MISVLGKCSLRMLADASIVEPEVMISSTSTILSGVCNVERHFIVSTCSLTVGLLFAVQKADFRIQVVLLRQLDAIPRPSDSISCAIR